MVSAVRLSSPSARVGLPYFQEAVWVAGSDRVRSGAIETRAMFWTPVSCARAEREASETEDSQK